MAGIEKAQIVLPDSLLPVIGHLSEIGNSTNAGAIADGVRDQIYDNMKAASATTKSAARSGAKDALPAKSLSADSSSRMLNTPADMPISKLEIEQFAGVAKQVFTKIDGDGNGYITKEQLAAALQDPSFKGREAQALAAMYMSYDNLAARSFPHGILHPILTAADLDRDGAIIDKIDKLEHKSSLVREYGDVTLRSATLSQSDIQSALADRNLVSFDREALQYLSDHFAEISHDGKIGQKELTDYDHRIFYDTEGCGLHSDIGWWMEEVYESQKANTSRDLYSTSDPLECIVPQAVRQGEEDGDCYFLATLAAAAQAHPQLIRDAISDNHDGTYTVRFPGDKDEPIVVKAPTEAELGLYAKAAPQGTWAAVMAKAYGEYLNDHFWQRFPRHIFTGYTPQETADRGFEGPVINLLTGGTHHTRTTLFSSQRQIAADLEKAFSSNPPKLVAADTLPLFPSSATATPDGFDTKHAYTILAFSPDGKGSGTVKVRNPHAGKDGTVDGTIDIPLETFMRNFSTIVIQD